jgi:glycosyltransferase involved in cell wall biosynthesis
MRIAVNAGSFTNCEYKQFLHLAISHPEENFIFIFNKPFAETFNFPENVTAVVVSRKKDSFLKWKIWYNFKIPIALKKHKEDIFISKSNISLKTKVSQLLISPDLTFIFQPSFLTKKDLRFFKKNTPRFLNKANEILVNSNFLKKEIIDRFKINEEKIKVLYPKIQDDFSGLNFEEKELIKEKYARGNEYFIYKGSISEQQNLLNLLKAFSFFKKRQKSNMQLLITGNRGINYEKFEESLRLFRFQKEVKVLENLSATETQKIIASAYAIIYVPAYESEPSQALEAIKYKIPAIVSSIPVMHEYFGEAALYADPENFKDVAEKMMQIFKDEKIRKQLIEKEKTEIEKFSNNNEEILFEIIKNAAKKNPFD